MMSSMGSTRGNTRSGAREKPAAKSTSQTTSKTGAGDTPVGKKATPDQIRLAQMFSDSSSNNKVDEKLKEKIQQVYDVTHKTEDDIMVALYDCQEDTEKAINLLLERAEGDQGEWETIGSKKKVKSNTPSSRGNNSNADNTSNSREGRTEKEGGGREKGGKDKEPRDRDNKERDGSYRGRGRGGRAQLPPRMTKGRGRDADSSSRDRDRNDQNNKWEGGETGRGRGRKGHDQTNGPSRRGRGPRSYTNSKFGTFEQNDAFKPGDNVWTNPPDTSTNDNMGDFTVSAWDGSAIATDSWTADDWSGDLAESKVFTPTPGQATPNTINSVQQAPAPPQQSPLSTNTQMPPSMPATMSVSSMAPSMAQSMAVQSSMGQTPQSMSGTMQQQSSGMPQMQQRDVMNSYSMEDSHTSSAPENFTRIDLAALFGKSAQHTPNVTTQMTGPPASMSDPMSSQRQSSSVFSQYGEIKSQPPISVNDSKANQMGMPPGQGVPGQEPSTGQQAQQRGQSQQSSKPTKKRMPPPSTKIPLSAVEMPVSARGLGVLDVQFGAMDLSMEPSVDFGVPSMLSGVPPSSTTLQGSVPMPTSGQLPSSMPSYSMVDSAIVTTPSHLSYPNKVQNDNYPSSTMNTSMLSNSPVASTISTTLEQRSSYGQAPQKQMAPEPIPLPNQNQVGYMNTQKSSPTQQMDSKSDKMQSGSYHTPTMPLQLSSLGSHPTSLANTAMSQSPSGMQSSTGLHSQIGLSSHANQQMRQTPNSYHPTSAAAMTTTVHSQASLASGLSSIPHAGGYTAGHSSSNMSGHPNSGLSATNLAGSNLGGSNLGASSMGASNLGGSGLSSHSTSGLSSSGGLTAGGLSSGPSTMSGLPSSTQPTGLSSSVSGLSSSGHLTGTTVSNSMAAQSNVQGTQLTSNKMGGLESRMNSSQHGMDHGHQTSSGLNSHSLSTSNVSTSSTTSSSALGYNTISGMSSGMTSVTSVGSSAFKSSLTSNKGPPNLPPGMPLFNHQYIMGHGILPVNPFAAAAATHQPFYNYDDLQLQLSRMPMGYSYDPQQFPQPATTLTSRDVSSHSSSPYSVTDQNKFTRGEAASPVASSLSTQQQQQQTGQAGHHQSQQATQQTAFLNAASVPPGYGYGGLPYYPSPGIIPPGLQYQPAVFPAVNTVQPNNRSQAGTTPHSAFQQTAYGQHGSHGAYGTGYDDLSQSQDFSKGGYNTVSQAGAKGTGGTVSVTAASAVQADMTASSYTNKAHSQSYADKQGFHTGTPPPFNFPMASANQGGPLQPATGYPHASFVPMMPHNAMLPHQLHSDGQGGSSQRSQGSSNQGKPVSKPPYGGSTYWGAN